LHREIAHGARRIHVVRLGETVRSELGGIFDPVMGRRMLNELISFATFSSVRESIEHFRAARSQANATSSWYEREQSIHLARAAGLIVVPTLIVATLVLAAAIRFLPSAETAAWVALVAVGCASAIALPRSHGSSRIAASPRVQIVTALQLAAPWAALPVLFSHAPADHLQVIIVAAATMMAASGSLFLPNSHLRPWATSRWFFCLASFNCGSKQLHSCALLR
jgi:hypothetical protein